MQDKFKYDPKKERPVICKHIVRKISILEHAYIPAGVYICILQCMTVGCNTLIFREQDFR